MLITLMPDDTSSTPLMRNGSLLFPHANKRLSRAKLVNGDTYFHNSGYTHKDRTATISLDLLSIDDEVLLNGWMEDNTDIVFSDNVGLYNSTIYSLDISSGTASLVLWIKESIVNNEDIYPVPSPVSWNDVTSDSFWEGYGDGSAYVLLSWDGTSWTGSGINSALRWYSLDLVGSAANGYAYPWGSWADGLKPTKFKITYSYTYSVGDPPNAFYIETYPDYDKLFYMSGFPVSGQEYDLDWDNPYEPGTHSAIYEFLWDFTCTLPNCSNSMNITKIELYY